MSIFSISQIKSRLKPVRPNLFYASVNMPALLKRYIETKDVEKLGGSALAGDNWLTRYNRSGVGGMEDTFSFRCEATEFPGRTIATLEDNSIGTTRKVPYDVIYNDITLQIIASRDMTERAFFELWMEHVVKNSSGSRSEGGLINFEDYYTGTLAIAQVDDSGAEIAKAYLYDAYPVQISGMNLSWEEQNTYQRFTVTMTYRYHNVEFSGR